MESGILLNTLNQQNKMYRYRDGREVFQGETLQDLFDTLERYSIDITQSIASSIYLLDGPEDGTSEYSIDRYKTHEDGELVPLSEVEEAYRDSR